MAFFVISWAMARVLAKGSSMLQQIPRPLFAVFYNGRADFPAEKELHLSDAFMGSGRTMMELDVPVINIKLGKGGGILQRSKVLHDYAALCNNIEECQHIGENDYVREGILRTIKSGVLVEYLTANIQEASGMLKAEYDYDMDMAVRAQESYDRGITQGITQGMTQGMTQGITQGEVRKARSVACLMLAECIPIATIARCTGLTQDEVLALQQNVSLK